MKDTIAMTPIGTIRSPYRSHDEVPIQGRFRQEAGGCAELKPAYVPGLKDLDGFSHAYLLFHMHLTDRTTIQGSPYLEDDIHGIFAIRSPHRPNHIGLTIVGIDRIEGNCLHFSNVDMLDGTPLLDIKPYVSHFDAFAGTRNGWLEKHFVEGRDWASRGGRNPAKRFAC